MRKKTPESPLFQKNPKIPVTRPHLSLYCPILPAPFKRVTLKIPGVIKFFLHIFFQIKIIFIMIKAGVNYRCFPGRAYPPVEIPIFGASEGFVKTSDLLKLIFSYESDRVNAGGGVEAAFKIPYLYPETLSDNSLRDI